MLVAEHGGPTMFARIGMTRALHAGKAGTLESRRQAREEIQDRQMSRGM
jgi:hypothetical protein